MEETNYKQYFITYSLQKVFQSLIVLMLFVDNLHHLIILSKYQLY